MSMATLERAVLTGAKVVFNNPKLRAKDILEWNTGSHIKPQDGEVTAFVSDPGVYVTIKKELDKRETNHGK